MPHLQTDLPEKFYNILHALIALRISRAKCRMLDLHDDILFESAPSFAESFQTYWQHVIDLYEATDPTTIPSVYRSVAIINLGTPEAVAVDCWLDQRCIALQLLPLDINAVVNQLNRDFHTRYTFSDVAMGPDQELRITFMFKNNPGLIANGIFATMPNTDRSEAYTLDAVNKNAPLF